MWRRRSMSRALGALVDGLARDCRSHDAAPSYSHNVDAPITLASARVEDGGTARMRRFFNRKEPRMKNQQSSQGDRKRSSNQPKQQQQSGTSAGESRRQSSQQPSEKPQSGRMQRDEQDQRER